MAEISLQPISSRHKLGRMRQGQTKSGLLYKKMMVSRKVESQNKWVNKWGKGARFIYHEYKTSWHKHLWVAFPALKRDKAPKSPQGKIVITSIRVRELDRDNLSGGCKPIMDYFVKNGYFYDDKEQYIEVETHQIKPVGRGREGTVIEIHYPAGE